MKNILVVAVLLSAISILAQEKKAPKASVPAASALTTLKPVLNIPASAQSAMNLIDGEKMRWHVRFLAHDLLEGRGTGARGGDIAAEYIGTQFALYGLDAAGDNGSYMQSVPIVLGNTLPESTFMLVPTGGPSMTLKYRDDYVSNNESLTTIGDVDAPIIYVGFGIEAPEYNWDDYKGMDVRGKVLLMNVNEPPSDDPKFFKGKALTYFGRWTYKYEEAARKGAVGVILIHKTEMASYGWDVVRNSWGSERAYLRDKNPKLKSASWVQLEVARKLVAASGMDLDKLMKSSESRDFQPVDIKARLQAHIVSTMKESKSANVVAILPGSDPKLKDEAILYSAHYDHLGIHPDQPGDNIYNGAADNATGCAVLLEMARAYASLPKAQRPKRSVIFAAVTAEEQGLRGSEYLGQKPPIPAGKISLGLNYDDIPPIGVPEQIEVTGAERQSVYPVVQATAKEFGLTIVPDPLPEAGHYYRSDHFSFSRVGIPSFSISEGMKFRDHPEEWGRKEAEDYVAHRYHQPSDEYTPSMIFTGNAKVAKFGFALGWKVANAPALASWTPGDEFEPARMSSQK